MGLDGRSKTVDIVRLGMQDMIQEEVKSKYWLNSKVAREFGEDNDADRVDRKIADTRESLNDVDQKIKLFEMTVGMEGAEGSEAELAALRQQKAQLSATLRSTKAEKGNAERNRAELKRKILLRADVVCATLSASGYDILNDIPEGFETVIIDEAAQSVEPSTLIPLKYNCKRCILVGDPLQLPPTVISQTAKQAGYERTLFERMQKLNCNVVMLSIQYRMHPQISVFPSNQFYASRLMDYQTMKTYGSVPFSSIFLSSYFPYFLTSAKDSVLTMKTLASDLMFSTMSRERNMALHPCATRLRRASWWT